MIRFKNDVIHSIKERLNTNWFTYSFLVNFDIKKDIDIFVISDTVK